MRPAPLAITASPAPAPEELAEQYAALQAAAAPRPRPPVADLQPEVMVPDVADAAPAPARPRRPGRPRRDRTVSPAASAPAPTAELEPCRVCKTTDPAHGRSQADLCGRVGCIETAAHRAQRRDRALLHARTLTTEQVIARLRKERTSRVRDDHPDDAGDDVAPFDPDDLGPGALATDGLG